MLKAVILIGGPLKGTRFRPLSLDIPKPLFPVAGLPMIQHHIEACVNVPNLKEILILGYYPTSELTQFVADMVQEYKVNIRYLQEFTALGTAGGLYHFRDQIRSGNPEAFFVLNGDVCADFPLVEMLRFHQEKKASLVTIMATEATRQQSVHYGCIVQDRDTSEVTHYVEKPSTFVSTLINCGVYICSIEIFQTFAAVFNTRQQEYYNDASGNGNRKEAAVIYLEIDVLMPLAGTGRVFALQTSNWWSQLKTAGSAIYANRHYLELYHSRHMDRLAQEDFVGEKEKEKEKEKRCNIIGDVYIHPTATVHTTATLGPNVSIEAGAVIGPGVRIRESIVLSGATILDHSLVLHSIVGRGSHVGQWTRVEGTPCDPNPNKPFAKMDNPPLFNSDGRLNPSITILGCSVKVPSEVILLNSIVLPYKELTRSFKNEIIL
ncbi:Mannose-1-phosphate guanyltransferase alpha-A [Cryptotermes secundus]|uniref:Mannose-1-phosphate guanyltransferase alpha-A n=1 Tax=Cryptotermes secundus TaxID=105785 RepID=A0A2J7R427_9NEOP|nr:mannose-1-phosphate guanyltransferase alpha-A isoform X2 [Cryptotermes secundus]PNF35588.1 Mannose-1-phosphate guanyltransferase alpha-A [Cryptotermes secundus]